MLKFNDKLMLKKKEEIAEVAGVYPGAQGGFNVPANGQTVYVIRIDGNNCYFPESVVELLFDKYIEKPIEQPKETLEAIADEILEKKTKKKVKKA